MKMSVDLSREIYNELKRFINVVDRDEAAETLVSVLIDNDISADDIKDAFKGEADIKRALTSYLKDHQEDEEEEDYGDDDEDDDYEN
jgi:predicted metal-binding transcription factor (methanogenesis marker protein 9)